MSSVSKLSFRSGKSEVEGTAGIDFDLFKRFAAVDFFFFLPFLFSVTSEPGGLPTGVDVPCCWSCCLLHGRG